MSSDVKGIIGKYEEDGLPVIVRFVREYPSPTIRGRFRWATVVSWKYDGSTNNGMPAKSENQRMLDLEHAIDALEQSQLCQHAYSRTGNSLKELVYYIADCEEFMSHFNATLANHPRYPIEIDFYEDEEWGDFQRILDLFKSCDT